MLRRTQQKVLWGLVVTICVIAGIGAIFYLNTAALIRDADRLDQTNAVINTLSQLYTNIQDLKISTRGYVANYDERFLNRYADAQSRARTNLEVLRALIPTMSEDESRSLRELESLFETRRRESQALIRTRRELGMFPALFILRRQLNDELTDDLRSKVNQLIERQRDQLDSRSINAQHSSSAAQAILVVGSAAEIFLAIMAALAMRRHIRERRNAIEALQQNESILRSFFDSGVIMMGVLELLDDQNECRHINDNAATAALFNTTSQALAGKTCTEIGVPRRYVDLWVEKCRLCRDSQATVRFDYFHEQCDPATGQTRGHWFDCSLCPIPIAPGALPRFSYAINNVTQRRQAEENLRRHHADLLLAKTAIEQQAASLATSTQQLETARASADAANSAKSTFLANMSHEIRTPLTAILGYAELLLEPDQSPSDRNDCLHVIRRSARHLLELINDILDLSKIEVGKMTLESIPTNPAQLIAEAVSIVRPRAEEKKVALKLEFDGPLPDKVMTDPLRLRQIVMNLLGNAVKFTSDGDVIVRARCDRDESTNAGALTICVVDTGIGMTRDQLDRIFKPFTQADETTTRRFGGTGLGLTISKRLTEMLGGTICAESDPGCGSQFTVTVPAGDLATAHWIHGLTETTFMDNAGSASSRDTILRGHILLAEDGRDNQRLISTHLRRAGAIVTVVDTGSAALKLLQEQPFDLVLMDMQMPELDGYDATRKVRGLGINIPIIALTAHAMAGDRDKCLAAGCTDYLTKPIDKAQLLWSVASHLAPTAAAAASHPERVETPPVPITAMPASGSLKSDFADDPQMADLVNEFVRELPGQVSQLAALLDQEHLEELRRAVHQLKGAGGGYGFAPITAEAARAEQIIRTGQDLEQIRSAVSALMQLLRRVDGFEPHATPAQTVETE